MSDISNQAASSTSGELSLDNLEALAREATPGPWEATHQTDDECYHAGYFIEAAGGKTISDDCTAPGDKDAQFIAAANPSAVLTLIDLARRALQPVASAPARPSAEQVMLSLRAEYDGRKTQPSLMEAAAPAAQAAEDAFYLYAQEQGKILGMPGLAARPSFVAGYLAALQRPAPAQAVSNSILGAMYAGFQRGDSVERVHAAVMTILAQQAEAATVEPLNEDIEQYHKGYRDGYEEARRELAAPVGQAEAAEPVAWCAPNSKGLPLFGKGWMFSPVKQLQATMPLYASPARKREEQE